MGFFTGTKDKWKMKSTLRPEQEPLANQLIQAGLGRGAGGAQGMAADYYRDLLGNNPEDLQAMVAPEMRNFNENIIPGISEQFAGMGAGGLSSSGFRNAAVGAGADLQERLASLRAQLRQHGAQGLQNIAQAGTQRFSQPIFQPGTPGFLEQIAPAAGTAIGSFAGPFGAAIGGMAGNWLSSSLKGKSSPYGGMASNAAQASGWGMR